MKTEEFESHQVFEKLNQLTSRISENEVREKINIEKLNLFDSACKYIQDRLNLTIPILVPVLEINTISQELQNCLGQINNFIGNSNIGHLNNAENHINSAVTKVRNLPLPFSKNDFNFSKAIANFENIVKSKYDSIEVEKKAVQEELKKVKADLLKKEKDIENLTNLLNTKISETNNLTKAFQTEFTNIKNISTQNIENDRKQYRNEINEDRKTFRNEITKDREEFKKDSEQTKKELNEKTTETVNRISTKLEEAKKLVNVIGNVGVTGNYQRIASEHKKTADNWRLLAIIFMTILSGLLIYTIWNVSTANYDWIKSVIRIIAAAALSYPATYASKESSKHRKLETINRKLELELASLTPFIEMLPEEKKREIKENLVNKYFGNNQEFFPERDNKDEEISLGGIEKLIKAFLPLIKK